MHTQTVFKLVPTLLATTFVALACEQSPNPEAPKRPDFSVQGGQTDRITGGGKLGDGRDFATFGFNARDGQGEFEWVQHCLDGAPSVPNCALGGFTFHGSTVTDYGTAPDNPTHCRAWSGEGEAKFKNGAPTGTTAFSVEACDLGTPGRATDFICFTFSTYTRSDFLAGGNIQLHEGTVEPALAACPAIPF